MLLPILKTDVLALYRRTLRAASRCRGDDWKTTMKELAKRSFRENRRVRDSTRIRRLIEDGREEIERMEYYLERAKSPVVPPVKETASLASAFREYVQKHKLPTEIQNLATWDIDELRGLSVDQAVDLLTIDKPTAHRLIAKIHGLLIRFKHNGDDGRQR